MAKRAKTKQPTEIEITVKDLHKAFDGHKVLRGVSLEVHQGDVIAIVGGSGCGKTVLVNHILGQLLPDRGHIQVTDHMAATPELIDLSELDSNELDRIHTQWGVVFQRNALFSGTVFDNIALWLREVRNLNTSEILPIARRVLKAVLLPNTADFMETDIVSLSGGMSKRLAVARALSMEPVVMFFDEPTTGLDPTSATQIHDLILKTHEIPLPDGKQRTTVIITHDKDLLKRLQPRTVMLHDGKVFFDGLFVDFQASKETIIRPYFDLMPVLQGRA